MAANTPRELTVECPYCKSPVGEQCRVKGGRKYNDTHISRIRKAMDLAVARAAKRRAAMPGQQARATIRRDVRTKLRSRG